MRDAAMFVFVSTPLADVLYFPLRKVSVKIPLKINLTINQHTDFTTGLVAIVTVLKLNGPEDPLSFDAFWVAASTELGPNDAWVGLNRS